MITPQPDVNSDLTRDAGSAPLTPCPTRAFSGGFPTAYIDPEGLFNGDRMAMLSDEAKLLWPYFWCASSPALGRLELNYRKILGRAFHNFKVPVTESQFWAVAREYRDCYLLFIYKHEGAIWGQWDTSEANLRKYKTAADRRMPAPDAKLFAEWQQLYLTAKLALHSDKSIDANLFEKVFEGLEKFSESFDNISKPSAIGNGVGVGFGIGNGNGNGNGEEINSVTNGNKKLIGCYQEFLALWQKPLTSGSVFTCSDVDLGCQVWISLIDKGTITSANVAAVFAGLEAHRASQKWKDGYVPGVAAFLGWSKDGRPAAPRWNDRPAPAKVENESDY